MRAIHIILVVRLSLLGSGCSKQPTPPDDEQALAMTQTCPPGTTAQEEVTADHRYWWCEQPDGVKHGPFLAWYPTGEKWSRQTYNQGVHHGPGIVWHKNGQREQLRHFRNGLEHGEHRIWRENGVLEFQTHYENGMRSGLFTHWDSDGDKAYEGRYVAGKKHGEWINWDHRDNISEIEVFDHGTLIETRTP